MVVLGSVWVYLIDGEVCFLYLGWVILELEVVCEILCIEIMEIFEVNVGCECEMMF